MEAYQQRVVDEKNELDAKREKLATFISSPEFVKLSDTAKDLLQKQAVTMKQYSVILESRIKLF